PLGETQTYRSLADSSLVINELITNTLKYCKPLPHENKKVFILIYKSGEEYILEYKDNGVETKPKTHVSQLTDFSLISLLVDRLKGRLEMVEMKGYHVKILFKDFES
ncbi:MAG: hypothetical protein ACPGSD_12805, partial [Flavobacteriales bacterium]